MARGIKQLIAELPGVRWLRRARYVSRLRRGGGRGLFWGVYSTHDEALAGARSHPAGLTLGYDTPALAEAGRQDYDQMHLRDYPGLLWLLTFLERGASTERVPTVVDLGGHLGGKFRAFKKYWRPELSISWVVIETQAAVDLAGKLTPGERPAGLSFTTDRSALSQALILFASGSLQYLERDPWALLDDVRDPPAHLVLNKVPLTDGDPLWTTQNADGKAIVPYHVWNRDEFLGQFAKRGYRLLDSWSIPDRSVSIPFHQTIGTTANSGLSLSRDSRL